MNITTSLPCDSRSLPSLRDTDNTRRCEVQLVDPLVAILRTAQLGYQSLLKRVIESVSVHAKRMGFVDYHEVAIVKEDLQRSKFRVSI